MKKLLLLATIALTQTIHADEPFAIPLRKGRNNWVFGKGDGENLFYQRYQFYRKQSTGYDTFSIFSPAILLQLYKYAENNTVEASFSLAPTEQNRQQGQCFINDSVGFPKSQARTFLLTKEQTIPSEIRSLLVEDVTKLCKTRVNLDPQDKNKFNGLDKLAADALASIQFGTIGEQLIKA